MPYNAKSQRSVIRSHYRVGDAIGDIREGRSHVLPVAKESGLRLACEIKFSKEM